MKIFVKLIGLFAVLMNAAALSGGTFRDNTDNPFPGFEPFDGGANNGKEIIEEEVITDPPTAEGDKPTAEEQEELDRIAAESNSELGIQNDELKNKEQNKEQNTEGDKKGEDAGGGISAVQIGDKILSAEDMEKVRAKMEQKFGKERMEKMDEDELLVWTKEYVNILDASKSINAKFQAAAAMERDMKAEQQKLEEERAKIDKQDQEANRVLKEIQNRKAELEAIKAKQPKDEYDDDEVLDLKIEKKAAAQEELTLDKQAKRLNDIIEQTRNDNQEIFYAMLVSELQGNIPELQTEKPVPDILLKIDEVDDDDAAAMEQAQVAQRVKMIFNGYLAEVEKNPDTKLTITKYYKTIKNNLPELKRTTAQSGKVTIEELKAGKMKDFYKKLAEKQAKQPSEPGGGGGSSHSTERIEEATDETAEAHWKSLGYSFNQL